MYSQDKVQKLLDAQRRLASTMTGQLKGMRDYKNPDFLHKMMVDAFQLREYGSAFRLEVFDPAGLPAEDYWEKLDKKAKACPCSCCMTVLPM